jgi:chorismate mutase
LLAHDTWSPINTQNTALHRDVISSFYFIRMGFTIAGMPIDRYGDIFSGYFCQACVRHIGHRIRVGTPVALHKRNSHNYLRDLTQELACIWLLEDLTSWLRKLKLSGSSYPDAYWSLSEALEDQVERFSGPVWTDQARAYFHQMAYCMRQWATVCKTLG